MVVKRQKSDANLGGGGAVVASHANRSNGAMIQAVSAFCGCISLGVVVDVLKGA